MKFPVCLLPALIPTTLFGQTVHDYPVSGIETETEKFDRIYHMAASHEAASRGGKIYSIEIISHLKDQTYVAALQHQQTARDALLGRSEGKREFIAVEFLEGTPQFPDGERGGHKLIPTNEVVQYTSVTGAKTSVKKYREDDGKPMSKEQFIAALKAGRQFRVPIKVEGQRPATYLIRW